MTHLIGQVTDAVSIPVIACGGVGKYEDFADGITKAAPTPSPPPISSISSS